MSDIVNFTQTTVNDLVTDLQTGKIGETLTKVFNSSSFQKLTSIQNRIKTLESQRAILDENIVKLNQELINMISGAQIINE